jgi:hypothetical protein
MKHLFILLSFIAFCLAGPQVHATTSGDAYINFENNVWTLGNSKIEKKLQFSNGTFKCISVRNKLTGREYLQANQENIEFSVNFGGTIYSGQGGGWTLSSTESKVGYQNALYLDVVLTNTAGLKVTLHYIVFPEVGVIKHQTRFQNTSGTTKNISDPSIFSYRLMHTDVSEVDLHYMTGGANFTGSNMLKTVGLNSSYARAFDSYDNPEAMNIEGDWSPNVVRKFNGSTIYSQFFVLRNRAKNDGLWMTFDYNGHWNTLVGNSQGTRVNLHGKIAGINLPVANGASITTGYHTIGTFTGDVDDMGNTILEYVYTYQWDYTIDDYLTSKSSTWAFRLDKNYGESIYKMLQWSRYFGLKGIHIDQFATSVAGDWNSHGQVDFAKARANAAKSGMWMKLWMPPWHMLEGSAVWNQHQDWRPGKDEKDWCGWHLNLANENAYNWMLSMVQNKIDTWGVYNLRVDGEPAYATNGSDNDMVRQSENLLRLFKSIKDTRPGMGIENCAGGGSTASMEMVRFSDAQQLTDGNSHHFTGYWNTLFIPPAKALHAFGTDTKRDTQFSNPVDHDHATNEITRQACDFQNYMNEKGIMGRWTKVFRPTMQGGDGSYFMQFMNRDNSKGYILPAVLFTSNPYFNKNVKLFPKGLIDNASYTVRARKGGMQPATQTGAYWEANGISFFNKDGESITFNIEAYPGAGTDKTAPSAPSSLTKQSGMCMFKSGVELNWKPGSDNNWISYYEVFVNGSPVTKIAAGTYAFVENGNLNANYQIRSVDGDGNASALVSVGQSTPSPTPTPTPTPSATPKATPTPNNNGPVANGIYKITVNHSGKSMDVWESWKAEAAYVIQMPFDGRESQKWQLEMVENGYYRITNVNSGLSLNVGGATSVDGLNIVQWKYTGEDHMKFQIKPIGNGLYQIIAKHSGKCVQVGAISMADKATVHQWVCENVQHEQWSFELIDGSTPTPTPTPTPDPTPTPTPTPAPTPDNQSKTISFGLSEGWNLISLPVQPADAKIESVLKSAGGTIAAVFAYDAKTQSYQSYIPSAESFDLKEMKTGVGYWAYATEQTSITITGTVSNTAVQMVEGWNLVGYNSATRQRVGSALKLIKENLMVAYGFDAARGNYTGYTPNGQLTDLQFMSPGAGYWLYVTEDSSWKLP